MARRSKTIVGLDIEPGSIAAVQVATADGLTVERAAVADLDPHVVRDGEVADGEALTEALRAMWSQNSWLDRKVRIGVANARIVVRVMDLPPLEDAKDLEAAVQFQAKDELPMAIDQAVIDYQSVGLVETPAGMRHRVVLVAARRDMIERLLNAARAAGLRPEGVDLSAFAMVRALGVEDGPVLYVSVGGLTNLAVAENGNCLFTRVSGGGLEAMAVDLAERQGLTLDHARAWLRHVGLDTPVDEVDGEAAIIADARSVLTDGARRVASRRPRLPGLPPHPERRPPDGRARPADRPRRRGARLRRGPRARARAARRAAHHARRARRGRRAAEHRRRPGGRGGRSMKAVNLIPADQRRSSGAAGKSGGARLRPARRSRDRRGDGRRADADEPLDRGEHGEGRRARGAGRRSRPRRSATSPPTSSSTRS